MKSKMRWKKILVIAIFFAFIFYYIVIVPFTRDSVTAEREKRSINEKPIFSIENYQTYATNFEAFYNDYIPFRYLLTKLDAKFKLMLHTSPSKSVIIGKDGWLFYDSAQSDGATNTLEDYSGQLYTTQQMESIKNEIVDAYNYCTERGKQFVFLIGPNKSSIYDEYMPSGYNKSSEYSRTDQLVEYIRKNTNIPCIYPKEKLKELRDEDQLYFKTDTHWNELGGYIAATEVMKELGIELPEFSQIQYEEFSFSGDLVNLLGVEYYTEDFIKNIVNMFNHEIELVDYDSEIDKYEYTTDNTNGKNVLILGDSFAEAILKPIGNNYSNITYLKSRYYQWVDTSNYDVVIYELVERSVSLLAD